MFKKRSRSCRIWRKSYELCVGGPCSAVLQEETKEDVEIHQLFPRLTVSLIHTGPNIVTRMRNGEGRLILRFMI